MQSHFVDSKLDFKTAKLHVARIKCLEQKKKNDLHKKYNLEQKKNNDLHKKYNFEQKKNNNLHKKYNLEVISCFFDASYTHYYAFDVDKGK